MSESANFNDFVLEMNLLADVQLLTNKGMPKYTEDSLQQLQRHLISRHYANLTWELAHLLWLIENSSENNAVLNFFWIAEAVHKDSAITWFDNFEIESLVDVKIECDSKGVSLCLRDHNFQLNFNRINLLAALLEFLLNQSHEIIDELHALLWGKGLNGIRQTSSLLQQRIYETLDFYLPPARAQQKLYFFRQNCQHKAIEKIDKNFTVLWQKASEVEGLSTLKNFFDNLCLYLRVKNNQWETLSVSELSDNELHSNYVFDFISKSANLEQTLDDLGDILKLFSQSQWSKLVLIARHQDISCQLPLSVSALWSFQATQSKLLQAFRNKQTLDLKEQFDNGVEPYNQHSSYLHALMKINQNSMLSCLHLIEQSFNANLEKAIGLNNAWLEKIRTSVNAVTADPTERQQEANSALLSLLQEANNCFKSNNRKGFNKKTICDSELPYLTAIESLVTLNKVLLALFNKIKKFSEQTGYLEDKFHADRCIIESELNKRYE